MRKVRGEKRKWMNISHNNLILRRDRSDNDNSSTTHNPRKPRRQRSLSLRLVS
mgnify:CR=1 FL=1